MRYLILIKDYIKDNLITIFIVLLIISLGINIYQFTSKSSLNNNEVANTSIEELTDKKEENESKEGEITFSAPYGFRSQMVTTFDGNEVKTYSTSTALTKEDVAKMNKEVLERQKRIDEYFRKQELLFRDFWRMF